MPEAVAPTTNEHEGKGKPGSTVTRAKRRGSDAMPEDVAPTTNERWVALRLTPFAQGILPGVGSP